CRKTSLADAQLESKKSAAVKVVNLCAPCRNPMDGAERPFLGEGGSWPVAVQVCAVGPLHTFQTGTDDFAMWALFFLEPAGATEGDLGCVVITLRQLRQAEVIEIARVLIVLIDGLHDFLFCLGIALRPVKAKRRGKM